MSSLVENTGLGSILARARAATGMSLQEVADQAGCSTAYVHKLEQDRVRTPSPRVLAGLARTLGVAYAQLMGAAGYDPPSTPAEGPPPPSRFSNAHIVEVLETLVGEIAELRADLSRLAANR